MSVLTEELALSRCRATSLDTIKHINCWGMGLSDISIVQYMTNLEVATFRFVGAGHYLMFCNHRHNSLYNLSVVPKYTHH